MDKCCKIMYLCDQSGSSAGKGGFMKEFTFSNDFFKNLDAFVYTCGYETCKPGHSYGPALRSGYLIHYILSGRGYYRLNGKTYCLGEDDAFLIRPDELTY